MKHSAAFTGEQFFEGPLGPKKPAPPGLFIAPEVIPPDKGLPTGPPSLDHPTPPLPQHLPSFPKLPNREAPPSPSPLSVDCLGAADMLLGVPRRMALSFYQQKRRRPSPGGRSLALLQALCSALCPGSFLTKIRSSGECLANGSASGPKPAVLGPGRCFQHRMLNADISASVGEGE